MDFMNRGNRPIQQNTQPHNPESTPVTPSTASTSPTRHSQPKGGKFKDKSKLVRTLLTLFLIAIGILLIAVLFFTVFSKNKGNNEAAYVKDDKFQAVFLNGGQVYFGKIRSINSKNLAMDTIYYLRVNQQVQPEQPAQANNNANNISLVKLGCELHGPEDAMIINREQVIFWENLKDDGQVAKAVAEYVKTNPDGQKCDQQNTTGTGVTNSGAANTGTTAPATGTTPATGNTRR
jgi:cbb3-type cytochrome oxidase subunit 3